MADPLRRTLLAKLRGKKSKKGATFGGGYDSTAPTTNGGREGNAKVLLVSEEAPVVFLGNLDCTTERMSTYENCVDGALLQTGTEGVVLVRESLATAKLSEVKRTQETRSGASRNDERLGVSHQRDVHFEGHVLRDSDVRLRQEFNKITLVGGKHFVPRQCSVGDSIGFGDSSNPVLCQTHSKTGVVTTQGGTSAGTEAHNRVGHIDIAQNSTLVFDSNTTLDTNSQEPVPANPEEHILIHNIKSYDPEFSGGDVRAPTLQSPTFFPTDLEICDINMASLKGTERSQRFLDSEDDDYYDNEILPFYETVKSNCESEKIKDNGEVSDSAMQETDRLRNQLQEAYYLLINAMSDINMDAQQQINTSLTEQQVMSSCSSHSRDSLCSRLSAKNIDSDSWSSGGEHSPQQVSDTDSLLLCMNENLESKGKGVSKSMANLNSSLRAVLQRSASDGAIRYPGGPFVCQTQKQEDSKETTVSQDADKVTLGTGVISEGQVFYDAVSSDELLREAVGDEDQTGQFRESSGSVNSLTGSSDSNTDGPSSQSPDNKQDLTSVQMQGPSSVINKGHGVTVNKMQEWMHKGRLLSSEMKQRIEGSSPSLPRSGAPDKSSPQGGIKPVTSSSRGVKTTNAKSPTIKSPRQPGSSAQPGRTVTRSGLNFCGPSKSKILPPC